MLFTKKAKPRRMLLGMVVVVSLLFVSRQGPDAVEMGPDAGIVRVVTPQHERASSRISPYGPGYERELVQAFLAQSGREAAFMEMDDPQAAMAALADGEVDLVAGYALDSSVGSEAGIEVGPAYGTVRPALVTRSEAGEATEGDAAACADPQLVVRREWEQSAHLDMDNLTTCMTTYMPDVLGGLDADLLELAVVDEDRFRLWQPFYNDLRMQTSVGGEVSLRWAWRKDKADLAREVEGFWRSPETEVLTADLEERYFGFLPRETDFQELAHISRTVETEVDQYDEVIRQQAEANGLDPLFLAAVIYQESRFDSQARSRTGVRGLMQLTEATATLLGVTDRSDPQQSIRGGSAYLHMLWQDLEGEGLTDWDRWCFVLAAYNQGPGNLKRAMRLAGEGTNGSVTWNDLRAAYLRLGRRGDGRCRGEEAVHFVDSVRYYYYILHGFVALARPEAEHLVPLLGGA